MKPNATIIWLVCLLFGSASALAQGQGIEREDVFWVRFMESGQSITLDGQLDEAAWDQAEVLNLEYGQNAGIPGSGWFIQNLAAGITEPTNPPAGTVRMLAQGDYLYLAIEVEDQSIGGSTGLWNFDGIFMPFSTPYEFGPTDDGFHHFPAFDEFMLAWWNAVDTTEAGQPLSGLMPRFHSHDARYGVGTDFSVADSQRTDEQIMNWDAGFTINGTTSDDSHGEDDGYIFEMRVNMAPMGYTVGDGDGDVVQMGLAIQDADYYWGDQAADQGATSRAWYQNQWGNFSTGSIKLHFDPTVTVNSGGLPTVSPDVLIPNASTFDAPTVDGALDEDVWMAADTAIALQYGNEELMASYPGVTEYNSGYYRPGASEEVPVVEPSMSAVKWFFKENTLYLGVDVDDQSVDTTRGEGGDGIRFTINARDTVSADQFLLPVEYIVTVGPDGEALLDGSGFATAPEGAYEVGVNLKGATTPADPFDVDEGYQIEIALDLTETLGYPDGRGDGAVFISAHNFDHDIFEDEANNYNVRTWWNRERTGGIPAWGYMDPDAEVGTAADDVAGVPGAFELRGNAPNPFTSSTTLHYELPQSGDVAVEVFNVLGQRVATVKAGPQAAGANSATLDAGALASGLYLYRLQVRAGSGDVLTSPTGRLVVVK